MAAWFREFPGLARAGALALGLAAVAVIADHLGKEIHWETAVLYGITLGIAMRWPIVLRETGIRVVLLSGLLVEALIHYGLPTGVGVLLVEFFTRMGALPRGGVHYWEWYRPLILLGVVSAAYGLYCLVVGDVSMVSPSLVLNLNSAAFLLSYSLWGFLSFCWTLLTARRHGVTFAAEYLQRMRQTWWVPLTFLLVAYGMRLVDLYADGLQVVACLLLLWLQSKVGPVFSAMNQDRAVARLVGLAVGQSAAQRQTSQRVLRMAYFIGRALPLAEDDIRQVGYAALLQDPLDSAPTVPLWLAHRPDAEQEEALRLHVSRAVAQAQRDGALSDVVRLIAFRYASYDGEGYPGVKGEAIPLSAQVLAAANAVVHLTSGPGGAPPADPAHAVDWIRTHAKDRFHPDVLLAMTNAFLDSRTTASVDTGLPETVRQLQGLVGDADQPSDLVIGLRRVWTQLRGQLKLAPELPTEVQAVARLSTFFASSRDALQTGQILVEAVGQLVGGKVMLALTEQDGDELGMRFQASYGLRVLSLDGRVIAVRGGEMSRSILNQEPVQIPDLREASTSMAQEVARTEGIRSALWVPLVSSGRTVGVLLVGMLRYHWFTPREVGLIHLLAGLAATALENSRLICEVADRYEHISAMKAFTDTLLDNLSTSIIVLDPEGRLSLANAAARNLFGTEFDLQVGHPLPDGLREACPAQPALEGEGRPEYDVAWGSAILEVQSAPLRDSSGILLGAICLARDVTKVRAMQQQVRRVEKLAAMGELAAGAAHEIRNPLTSIRGFIQLVQARASGAEGEFFQIVLNEIDRIDAIIKDLLLLARPSELELTNMSLPHLVDEVLMLLQSDLQNQNVAVLREFDPAVTAVPVDPKMLKQLLFNLIINAKQAMPFGGTVRLGLRPSGTDYVVLDIADTGVGISPDNLKRLFVPFFTTKEEGTGLGLALCYSIVQAHRGRIDVESRVGVGTTFSITLPVNQAT